MVTIAAVISHTAFRSRPTKILSTILPMIHAEREVVSAIRPIIAKAKAYPFQCLAPWSASSRRNIAFEGEWRMEPMRPRASRQSDNPTVLRGVCPRPAFHSGGGDTAPSFRPSLSSKAILWKCRAA